MTIEISKGLLANALKLIASGAVGAAIFSLPVAGNPRAAIGATVGAAAFAWVSGRSRNEYNRDYIVAHLDRVQDSFYSSFSSLTDKVVNLKTDESKRKLDEAFNYLFTNQGGLVTLAQLTATSGADPNDCALYLAEKLKLLQAQQVEPNAFVFSGHPQSIIQKIEEQLLAQLTAKLQQQAQQAAQVQAQAQAQQQAPTLDIERLLAAYQQQQAEAGREAWRQQNGIPAPAPGVDPGQAAAFGGLI